MILICKFFFPVSTKGNLVPFNQGIKFNIYIFRMLGFLRAHKREGTSKCS